MNRMPENDNIIKLPLNLAIKYLAYRPRTTFEIVTYLKKKGIEEACIDPVVEILKERKYLDDKNYAQLFIENKVKYKPKSKFALTYDLKKKGIATSIIEKILISYNDTDLAVSCVESKIKLWQGLTCEKFKMKIMNFLRYRGFNYDTCVSTLNHFICLKKDQS